jgi:hypothetical protein
MIEPDVPGAGSMNRVSEVVDPPRVGIAPLPRHANGALIIEPEFSAQLGSRFLLERDSPRVLDQEQLE